MCILGHRFIVTMEWCGLSHCLFAFVRAGKKLRESEVEPLVSTLLVTRGATRIYVAAATARRYY